MAVTKTDLPAAMPPAAALPRDEAESLGGVARDVWWLMRARWRIGWNTFRRGARWRRIIFAVVLGALGILALAALATSYGLTRLIVNVTEDPLRADVVINSALNGALVLSFMVSFTVALAALYLSKDLDLLLSAPLSRRAVFIAKLAAGLTPAHVVILGMSSLPLIGHGLAMGYDRSYYLAAFAAMAMVPLMPVAIGSVSVVFIVRRVPAQRLGEVVGLIVMAMTLSIAMVLGSARQIQDAVSLSDLLGLFDRFRNPYSPAEWLTRAVASSGRHEAQEALLWFGLVLLFSLLAYVPVALVSSGMYYEGWLRMQSAAQRSELRRNWLPWSRTDRAIDLNRPSGWFRWLSPPTVAVLRKDLRVIPRDLTNMAQVLSPLAIGVFFVLQQLLYPVRFGSEDVPQAFVVPLLSMLSAGVAAGVSAMIMTRFGLTAFSFEGRSYWIIKGSPIEQRELVNAKFLVAYLPYLILAGGLILLLEFARALSDARLFGNNLFFDTLAAIDVPMMLYAFFVTAVVGAGTVAITLAIGAARPNLRWDTPHEMLTPDIGCMSIVLYGGYGGVTGLSLALPAAVSRFAVIEAPWLIWGWGLGAGLLLTAIAVVGGLRVAAGELEAIGE